MIRSQEASTLDWDASPHEYLNIEPDSEISGNMRTIFYGPHLRYIGSKHHSYGRSNSFLLMMFDSVLGSVDLTRHDVKVDSCVPWLIISCFP